MEGSKDNIRIMKDGQAVVDEVANRISDLSTAASTVMPIADLTVSVGRLKIPKVPRTRV